MVVRQIGCILLRMRIGGEHVCFIIYLFIWAWNSFSNWTAVRFSRRTIFIELLLQYYLNNIGAWHAYCSSVHLLAEWIRRKAKANNEGNLDQLSLACNKLGELHFKNSCYESALKEYKVGKRVCTLQSCHVDFVINTMHFLTFSALTNKIH